MSDITDRLIMVEAELNAVGCRRTAKTVRQARLDIISLRSMYSDMYIRYLELRIGGPDD